MMRFIRSLFRNRTTAVPEVESPAISVVEAPAPSYQPVSAIFRDHVVAAIDLMGTEGATLEDKALLDLMVSHGIPFVEAVELLLFLPVAFAVHFLPEVHWRATYKEMRGNDIVDRCYGDTPSFQVIFPVACSYFHDSPQREIVLNIAGRDPLIKSINELMKKNPQLSLKDVEVSEEYVIR